MEKILVTGGTGLVGSNLKKIIEKSEEQNKYIFLSSNDCDLRDYDQVKSTFLTIAPTIVIHLAANVGGLYKNLNNNAKMFEDNLLINFNLLKACAENDSVKKVITCLSTCIFPDIESNNIKKETLDESDLHNGFPHKSNYGYAYAKRMMHIQSMIYNDTGKKAIISLCPTNLYGPYDNFDLETSHVVPALVRKSLSNKILLVRGDGSPKRQFLYVKDFVKIILFCIKNDIKYDLICCAPSEEMTIKDISDVISSFNDNTIVFDTTYSNGQYSKKVSNKRLLEVINNFKFTPFKEGIRETIEYVLNHNIV